MGVNDRDEKLDAAIEELLERGDLDKGAPAYGAALNVIHTGYESLTRMQKALYDAVVVPALKKRRDEVAGNQTGKRAGR